MTVCMSSDFVSGAALKIIQLERLELGSECQSEPGRGESNMRYTISVIVIHQLVAAGRLQILFTFNKFQCNLFSIFSHLLHGSGGC